TAVLAAARLVDRRLEARAGCRSAALVARVQDDLRFVPSDTGRRVACIAHSVVVFVGLVRIEDRRAVVLVVREAVEIAIRSSPGCPGDHEERCGDEGEEEEETPHGQVAGTEASTNPGSSSSSRAAVLFPLA